MTTHEWVPGDVVAYPERFGEPVPLLVLDPGPWTLRMRRGRLSLAAVGDGVLVLGLQERERESTPAESIALLREIAADFDVDVLGSAAAPPLPDRYVAGDTYRVGQAGWRLAGPRSPRVYVASLDGLDHFGDVVSRHEEEHRQDKEEAAARRALSQRVTACAEALRDLLDLDRLPRLNGGGSVYLEPSETVALLGVLPAAAGLSLPAVPEPEVTDRVDKPEGRPVGRAATGEVIALSTQRWGTRSALVLDTGLWSVQTARFGRQRLLPAHLAPAGPRTSAAGIPVLLQKPDEDDDDWSDQDASAPERLRDLAAVIDLTAFDRTWLVDRHGGNWSTPAGQRTRLRLVAPHLNFPTWEEHLAWREHLNAGYRTDHEHRKALVAWAHEVAPLLTAVAGDGVDPVALPTWSAGQIALAPDTAERLIGLATPTTA